MPSNTINTKNTITLVTIRSEIILNIKDLTMVEVIDPVVDTDIFQCFSSSGSCLKGRTIDKAPLNTPAF